MADPVLELDAAGSNVDGTNPGTAMLLVDSTTGWGLTAFDAPAPELKLLWTSNIDMDGSLRADPGNYENRTVTASLDVERSTAALTQAQLRILGHKIGKIVREGGTLKVTYPSGNTFVFDLLAGSHNVAFNEVFVLGNLAEVTVSFTCLPGARGAEQDLGDNTETTLPVLIFSEASVPGDLKTFGRVVADNDGSFDQSWMTWGVENDALYTHTTSAGSGALFYEAETRTALGGSATAAGPAGASGAGSNVMRNTALAGVYQAILSTQATGAGSHLSHVGLFRFYARVQIPTTNTGTTTVVLEWAIGDFRRFTRNDTNAKVLTNSAEGKWQLLDLGLVNLAKVGQGTHRWEGRIVAKSTVAGDDIDVDYLMMVPANHGSGVVVAVDQIATSTGFTAVDGFDQTAGALNAKVLPIGGSWTTSGGDADDFQVSGSGTVTRVSVSDTPLLNTYIGRLALAGTSTLTNCAVELTAKLSVSAFDVETGLVLRRVDASNFLFIRTVWAIQYMEVWKVIAGALNFVGWTWAAGTGAAGPAPINTNYRIRAEAHASGRLLVWYAQEAGAMGNPVFMVDDTALATGGTLASGSMGFYDTQTQALASTRTYSSFSAYAVTPDAAAYAGQSLEIRHNRAMREDAAGSVWAPVASIGDYLQVPPSGQENRSARMIVKFCRNNPAAGPDSAIDDLSARLFVTPRYLNVPSA